MSRCSSDVATLRATSTNALELGGGVGHAVSSRGTAAGDGRREVGWFASRQHGDADALPALGRLGGATDMGGLEGDELAVASAQEGASGRRLAERGRGGVVDDVVAVGRSRTRRPMRSDDVGPHVAGDDPGRPLRGQHEVDAERAARRSDAHEAADEVGQLVGEQLELVDDDDEAGEPRTIGAPAARWAR